LITKFSPPNCPPRLRGTCTPGRNSANCNLP
jgi:hypothetical protein